MAEGKTLGEKMRSLLGRKLSKQIEEEVAKEVAKEVEKRLYQRVYEHTVSSALRFGDEFRNQAVIAVTAAFAFLIALSWREPIQQSATNFISYLGIGGKDIYLQYLSALLITLVAALALMLLSRWKSSKAESGNVE